MINIIAKNEQGKNITLFATTDLSKALFRLERKYNDFKGMVYAVDPNGNETKIEEF